MATYLSLSSVAYRQVRRLAIRSEKADLLNLDGERTGLSPFTAEVLPDSLQDSR
jgi:diacylglycerol kinase family enzyme